jgi:hypothetical protein
MKLDHVSYVTSHDQIADTVQRIGALLGSAFQDGGIHPRFGTRNFTAPLQGGQYIEVVCPMDHPATEQTNWGKAVSNKSAEGGGWFTWVFSVDNLEGIEGKFGRSAIEGHRTRPDGIDLRWKQIGVKEIADSPELPFFIEWHSKEHPSQDGKPISKISKLVIADDRKLADSWFKEEIIAGMNDTEIEWVGNQENEGFSGILAVHFLTPHGIVIIE